MLFNIVSLGKSGACRAVVAGLLPPDSRCCMLRSMDPEPQPCDLESCSPIQTSIPTFKLRAYRLLHLPNVRSGSLVFKFVAGSQQQLAVVMSSPGPKAKQPSIHAFFGGASAKKLAASAEIGAGKVEKTKPAQTQQTEKKKRSVSGCQAGDGKNAPQVQ